MIDSGDSRLVRRFGAALSFVAISAMPLLDGGVARAQLVSDVRLDDSIPGITRDEVPHGPPGSEDTFVIGDDHGITVGTNRLHSFAAFDLAAGDRAVFETARDPGMIRNVISRVTSSGPSMISGEIDSRIPGASLFLLNPAGFMFGPTARVDVAGGLFVSGADGLEFANGRVLLLSEAFEADDPQPDWTLYDASPKAFRFEALPFHDDGSDDGLAGEVVVEGTSDSTRGLYATSTFVEVGEEALCCAGDVTIVGRRIKLNANPDDDRDRVTIGAGGPVDSEDPRADEIRLAEIRLAAVGNSAATVPLDVAGYSVVSGADPETSGLVHLGRNHELTADTPGQGAGRLVIRGGRLVMDRSQRDTSFGGVSSDPDAARPFAIDVGVAGSVRLNAGAKLEAQDRADFARRGTGAIRIHSGRLELNDAQITNFAASGNSGGGIEIVTGSFEASGTSTVQTVVQGAPTNWGSAGDITVTKSEPNPTISRADATPRSETVGDGSTDFALRDSARVVSQTQGTGDSGSIFVSGFDVVDVAGGLETSATTISEGSAGAIQVDAAHVRVAEGAIVSQSDSRRSAGDIRVDAGQIELVGGRIESITRAEGPAGSVTLDATQGIELSADGAGTPSVVRSLTEQRLLDSSGGELIAGSTGNSGNVTLRAERIVISGASDRSDEPGSIVGVSVGGSGRGGFVTVEATDELRLTGDSRILNVTNQAKEIPTDATENPGGSFVAATGHGGPVTIRAGNVVIESASEISATTGGPGEAGLVTLDLTGALRIRGTPSGDDDPTGVFARSGFGGCVEECGGPLGDAGGVVVHAAAVYLEEGGQISATSTALGGGNAGDITLDLTGELRVDGIQIVESSDGMLLGFIQSGVITQGLSGRAGNVVIDAARLVVTDGGAITADTLGGEPAGDVTIHAGSVLVSNSSVDTPVDLEVETRISSGTVDPRDAGPAGRISIVAEGDLEVSNGARIETASRGDGSSGDIVLGGATVAILDGGRVSARTRIDRQIPVDSGSSVGNVDISARDRVYLSGAAIETDSNRPRSGNVTVTAAREFVSADDGSTITTTVDADNSEAGNVSISAPLVAFDDVAIDVGSEGDASPAGAITIEAPRGYFSTRRTSLQAISGDPSIEDGEILVTSPQLEILSELVLDEPTTLGRKDELEETCLARRSAAGSFQIRSTSGLAPSPDDDLAPEAGRSGAAEDPCAEP